MTDDTATRGMDLKPGDLVAGKFRIARILGAGGMGTVFAAKHIHLDETVAIKILKPEIVSDREVVSRFAREARTAAKIKSEHVARVIDVGALDDGSPFIVLEYLDGDDLESLLTKERTLRPAEAVEYVLQACEAIAEAHSLGIIHRDLKPANLFRVRRADGTYTVKVLDFGISKLTGIAAEQNMTMTKTAVVMGSPLYMSPEQLGSSRNVDVHSDIWSIGIILYELLSGNVPFAGNSFSELCVKIVTTPLPSLDSGNIPIPPALVSVVSRCLEKERQRRFSNIGELAVALAPFASSRAKLSIERIVGVLGQHGRTDLGATEASASDLPRTPDAGSDTVNPWGRTKPANAQRRSALVWAISLPLLLVSSIATLVGMRINANRSELQRATATAADISMQSARPPTQVSATPKVAASSSPAVASATVTGAPRTEASAPTPSPEANTQANKRAIRFLEPTQQNAQHSTHAPALDAPKLDSQPSPTEPVAHASATPDTRPLVAEPPKKRSVYDDRK